MRIIYDDNGYDYNNYDANDNENNDDDVDDDGGGDDNSSIVIGYEQNDSKTHHDSSRLIIWLTMASRISLRCLDWDSSHVS